jgi:hypothetical protein
MFEARVINLCNHDIATNFGAIVGEVILVDSCACTVILFAVIIIIFLKKRNRIFACGGTVQNRFFGGIRCRPFLF